jgi:hypothetical protein
MLCKKKLNHCRKNVIIVKKFRHTVFKHCLIFIKMSFNMNTTVMNDKNMVRAGGVVGPEKKTERLGDSQGPLQIVCYTPKNAAGTVSLLKNPNTLMKKTLTTDQDLVIVPSNAIIDCIEFFGFNNFSVKGSFNIGLGQLNDSILMPLIENSDSVVANEKVGGCRQFISTSSNGKNNKSLVLFDSNVNIVLENAITSGGLKVIISYHLKV